MPQTPAVQVATLHVGGVGQLAGVKHATQTPLALQKGALLGQSTHWTPPTPQVSFPLVWHVPTFPGPLEQQPPEQLCAVQTQIPDALHASPSGQSMHWTPLMPQLVSELVRQMPGLPGPFEQQPFGQLSALQTQTPLTQSSPGSTQMSPSPFGGAQPPQLSSSVSVSTHVPAQQRKPSALQPAAVVLLRLVIPQTRLSQVAT